MTSCRVVSHWAEKHNTINNLEITIIEQIFAKEEELNTKLLTREIYWQHALMSFEPYGLNKRDDLYSSRTRF